MTKLILIIAILTTFCIGYMIGGIVGYRKACKYYETQQTPEYVEQYLIDHKE